MRLHAHNVGGSVCVCVCACARMHGLSFEGGAWLRAHGWNKEGTLFTCIARQSKLASSSASKYKAQKQTWREQEEVGCG